MQITLSKEEADAVLGRLSDPELYNAMGVAIAEAARARLIQYPAPSRKPQPFKSAKQRRYFFAALRDGRIAVPYRRGGRRSQGMGRRWVILRESGAIVLKNTASYSKWVQEQQAQSGYHRGNWETDEQAVEQLDRGGMLEQVAYDVLAGAIQGAG